MKKQTEPGKCPNCGSEQVTYDEYYTDTDGVGYAFSCDDCGRNFIEWYVLTYVETIEK